MAKLTGLTEWQMRMGKLSETIIDNNVYTPCSKNNESEAFSLKRFAHTWIQFLNDALGINKLRK